LGLTNQWHFYVFTNDSPYTNAAILTFLPPTLSLPRLGVEAGNLNNASSAEADIDVYVSRDAGMTNLDPAVIAAADKSLGRGGTETIIYTNAVQGVYYIGVKSESQTAADFGLLVVFSEAPFAATDADGNQTLRGFPVPAPIPDGTPTDPGEVYVFALSPQPLSVRRVIVTNTISHELMSDLSGQLSHNHISAFLNNHTALGAVTNRAFVYDDSAQHDVPNAQSTDAPGSLRNFAGAGGLGQWLLTMLDDAPGHVGTNNNMTVFLEQQKDLLQGFTTTVLPDACSEEVLSVPPQAASLTVAAAVLAGTGPVLLEICPLFGINRDCQHTLISGPGTNTLTVDKSSTPPLNAGQYLVRLCNQGPDTVAVPVRASLVSDPNGAVPVRFSSPGPTAILDDAVSLASINVSTSAPVVSLEVGVRVDHPRVSDLVLHLVSPNGTRVLLANNRGGASAEGMGTDSLQTNTISASASGGSTASTNVIDTGQTSGSFTIAYDFYALPDDMRVYYQDTLLFDSGMVSGAGSTSVLYGPGTSTHVTIIMNEAGNTDTNTAWEYHVTTTFANYRYVNFTEDTNATLLPIKFAAPPFTNANYAGTNPALANTIFFLPEDALGLNRVVGENAAGPWTLELWDNRAGPVTTNPAPTLRSWQLSFLLASPPPLPIPLTSGLPQTNIVGAGQIQYFAVDVPPWASFATNSLVAASAPVNLLFNQLAPPSGSNGPGDFTLVASSTGGVRTLQTNGVPPLLPGARYYLGAQNTNPTALSVVVKVDFDVSQVITLQNGIPYANTNAGTGRATDYYLYSVSTNAARAQFEVVGPTADLTLVARKGLPLPSLGSYDFLSANPGPNDELIALFNSSIPVALAAGDWFLAAINVSGGPAAYSVLASEWPVVGTNIVITNPQAFSNSFCLTWTSL
ncbi:MAG: hypothetical protein DME25_11335, partial [Verrucomicrobia bacterium]